VTGDTWTEREALQAMLLASSNNHAEMLARWAYGSLDGYLSATDAWLADHDMTSVHVVDPTGLSPESVGSGADLARLSALALADPFLAETLSLDVVTTTRGATFQNDIRYRVTDGIISVSRSYTDEAGVCFLFAVPVPVGDQTVRVYGAFLGEPSYEQLDADLDAFLASVPAAISSHLLVAPGSPVARYETAWGGTAVGVVRDELRGTDWGSRSGPVSAETRTVTTAGKGARVGTATVRTREGELTSPVVLDEALTDPGPLWRLLAPTVVVPRFIDWVTGKA
jgi:D-alanyl-D-alanine carboxypeptidase (penicillin-binding protein 5/6)